MQDSEEVERIFDGDCTVVALTDNKAISLIKAAQLNRRAVGLRLTLRLVKEVPHALHLTEPDDARGGKGGACASAAADAVRGGERERERERETEREREREREPRAKAIGAEAIAAIHGVAPTHYVYKLGAQLAAAMEKPGSVKQSAHTEPMEAEEDPEEFTCTIKLDLMDDPVCIVHVNELEPRRRYERALLLAHFQAQYDKRIRVHMEQYADEAAQSGLSAVTVAESHGLAYPSARPPAPSEAPVWALDCLDMPPDETERIDGSTFGFSDRIQSPHARLGGG